MPYCAGLAEPDGAAWFPDSGLWLVGSYGQMHKSPECLYVVFSKVEYESGTVPGQGGDGMPDCFGADYLTGGSQLPGPSLWIVGPYDQQKNNPNCKYLVPTKAQFESAAGTPDQGAGGTVMPEWGFAAIIVVIFVLGWIAGGQR